MTPRVNEFGQPIGEPLPGWQPPPPPPNHSLDGKWCRLEPLDASRHATPLYEAVRQERDDRAWTYMAYGPFPDFAAYSHWLEQQSSGTDPRFYAIVDLTDDHPAGVAAFLRIAPAAGSLEVGHIYFSPRLRQQIAATDAMHVMMRWAFAAGYRRYEWKCDALNAPSRAAATRLGLTFEGVFRQAIVTKGRNRDTAWYAAVDREWPALQQAFDTWLDPRNFDSRGRQKTRLADLTRLALRNSASAASDQVR